MAGLLTPLDLFVFFGMLVFVMALGLWAGRKEEDTADYYLAGRNASWWGVAGSIFGSNVSANHLVGMMGVGFAIGFAQSHFEITAIAGLLALCYVFLPVYRKLNVYTLSEYLSRRYDDKSRVAYALIMIVIMVVIQMVPGFYIGSRALNLLLGSGDTASAQAVVNEAGEIVEITVPHGGSGYASAPHVIVAPPSRERAAEAARATAVLEGDRIARITIDAPGSGYDSAVPPPVRLQGGASFNAELNPGDVDPRWYIAGILMMAIVTGTYTIAGGLKAVIVTDVIQSMLLLASGILIAVVTFSQAEIGGWTGLLALDDAANGGRERLHLYNPIDHPQLPWTGVLSGLMVLHFYYWGTNQFIVQRALAARDDSTARLGIVVAGFFKLLIPFFSIGTGIAAFYLFKQRGIQVAQDVVFVHLLTELVRPIGFGLVGLVAAGVVGAILSSLDSMMNSAATIITFDVYKRFIDPQASEKRLIQVGRLCILISITGAALLTIFTADPNSRASFFLQIADHQSKLIAGVVVAFVLGIFWRGATAWGAIVAIVGGIVLSYGIPVVYDRVVGTTEIASATADNWNAAGKPPSAGTELHIRVAGVFPVTEPAIQESSTLYVGKVEGKSFTLHTTAEAAASGEEKVTLVHPLVGTAALYRADRTGLVSWFGVHLNFFHAVFVAAVIAALMHVGVSLVTRRDAKKAELTMLGLGIITPARLRNGALLLLAALALFAVLAVAMVYKQLAPWLCGTIAAAATWAAFIAFAWFDRETPATEKPPNLLRDDRCWAGLLAAAAVWLMYAFY